VAQAGRGRILAACYGLDDGQWHVLTAPSLTNFDELAQKINRPALCAGEIDAEAAQILRRGAGQKARIVSPASRLRRAAYLAEIVAGRLEAGWQDDPDALSPIYISMP